jgi:hypothetical protein
LSLALRLSGGTLGLAIWDPWHIILIAALKWIRIMGYMILIYTDHWEFTRFFWKKGATLVCSNELSRSSRWKQWCFRHLPAAALSLASSAPAFCSLWYRRLKRKGLGSDSVGDVDFIARYRLSNMFTYVNTTHTINTVTADKSTLY